MNVYYIINGRRFYDEAMLRERIGMSKSSLHSLLKSQNIDENNILLYQNRLLVSLDGLKTIVANESKKKQGNRINELTAKRKAKYEDYQKEKASSWKKQLKKYELDIIDIQIKIERLKAQHD